MSDERKYTKTTEVKTETNEDSDGVPDGEYKEETTIKTERTVEKKKKEPVIIIEKH